MRILFIRKFRYRFNPVHKKFFRFNSKHQVRKKASGYFIKTATVFLIMTLILSIIGCRNAEPYAAEKGISKMQAALTLFSNETVIDVIGNNDLYNDIIITEKNENGEIISIKTDVLKANKLKSEIMLKLQEKLNTFDNITVFLPIGVFLGRNIFSGLGFNIPIKILGTNNLSVDLLTDFSSAGINQTRLLIQLDIKITVSVMALLSCKAADIVTQIPISDTVIVGNTPEFYGSLN